MVEATNGSSINIEVFLKRLGTTIQYLEVHLVFGGLVGKSLVGTHTLNIDILGPTTSRLPRSSQAQFVSSQEKIDQNWGLNSGEAENRRMC